MFTDFERKRPFLAFRFPAIVYAAVIFAMSSISGSELPELPFFSFDKIVHTIEFGLFGILLYRAFRFPKPLKNPFAMTVLIGIPYAALDEVHQLFVPGRYCDPADFVMDVVGILVFAGISSKLNRA